MLPQATWLTPNALLMIGLVASAMAAGLASRPFAPYRMGTRVDSASCLFRTLTPGLTHCSRHGHQDLRRGKHLQSPLTGVRDAVTIGVSNFE